MLFYCLKCKKNIENINLRVLKTNNGKTTLYMMEKNQRFIKEQEPIDILSSLGLLKTPLSKIPLLGDILF